MIAVNQVLSDMILSSVVNHVIVMPLVPEMLKLFVTLRPVNVRVSVPLDLVNAQVVLLGITITQHAPNVIVLLPV